MTHNTVMMGRSTFWGDLQDGDHWFCHQNAADVEEYRAPQDDRANLGDDVRTFHTPTAARLSDHAWSRRQHHRCGGLLVYHS